MSRTTVTYKGSSDQRIDMRWLSDALINKASADVINQQRLNIGSNQVEVGDLFTISGDLSTTEVALENSNSKMDYIGHALPNDTQMIVEGDCGHYAGANLAGGNLIINGNALDYLGCMMQNGTLEVKGDCRNYAGGAAVGEKKGMAGGLVLVHGNAGDFLGDLMRRGIMMICGDIGNHCGSRMIAGTITNLGKIGTHVGMGMRRGTLLFPNKPQDDLVGFHDCGRHSLGYLTLLVNELRRPDSAFRALHPMRRRVQKYIGDTSTEGQGELLIWIG